MAQPTITKIKKRSTGTTYPVSVPGIEESILLAQQSAQQAAAAATSAVDVVRATQEVVGGYLIPYYDTGVSYNRGDLVFYSGFVWRCLNDKAPGAWAPDAWIQTSLYQEYMRLQGASDDYETVTIRLATPGFITSLSGKNVHVTYNGQTDTFTTNADGEVFVSIPFGVEYTITVDDIEGFTTPASRTRIANMHFRLVNMNYMQAFVGIYAVDKYGELTPIDDWDTADNPNAAAMYFSNSQTSFMLKLNEAILSGQWQAQNVLIPGVTTTSSAVTATTIMSGALDTDRIVSFARTKSLENPALYPNPTFYAPAACYASERILTLGNRTYNGYLPASGQLLVAKENNADINAALTKLGGRTYNLSSGNWWSSSQNSATRAWFLGNGSLYNYNKDSSNQFLPFFDF